MALPCLFHHFNRKSSTSMIHRGATFVGELRAWEILSQGLLTNKDKIVPVESYDCPHSSKAGYLYSDDLGGSDLILFHFIPDLSRGNAEYSRSL